MKVAFPGTTTAAEPHIKSILHTWKRQYGFLSGILSKSGNNWNSITKKVDCTQETWDEASKAYDVMKNKKEETWPYYEAWKEIFGKDRATGENETDFADAVNEVFKACETNTTEAAFMDPANLDAMGTTNLYEAMGTSTFDSASACGVTPKSNKRKAVTSGEDRFVEAVTEFAGKADATLTELVQSLATNKDDKIARQAVFEALGAFPELTLHEKVTIGRKLAKDKEELDFFFSLPHDARQVVVNDMKSSIKTA